jgi:hypothetical protein
MTVSKGWILREFKYEKQTLEIGLRISKRDHKRCKFLWP